MTKVALVTGASKGIGRSIAEKLYMNDFIVVMCARSENELSKTKEALIKAHGKRQDILTIPCDISNFKQVKAMVETINDKFKKVDVLVNNAGIVVIKNAKRTPAWKVPNQQWKKVVDVNLTGAFYCVKCVLPLMTKQKWGRLNISSASARMGGIISSVDYISSKAGMVGLTKGLAYELGDFNITANTITPGRIATEMLAGAKVDQSWINTHVPLKRLGKGEDVGGLVCFLASEEAGYITGTTIDVNGGWVIC